MHGTKLKKEYVYNSNNSRTDTTDKADTTDTSKLKDAVVEVGLDMLDIELDIDTNKKLDVKLEANPEVNLESGSLSNPESVYMSHDEELCVIKYLTSHRLNVNIRQVYDYE